MLRDVVPFSEVWSTIRANSQTTHAISSLVKFIEGKVGGHMVYNTASFPFMRADLADLFEMVNTLKKAGLVLSYGPRNDLPDEPRMREWRIKYQENDSSGGMALDDRAALTAAIAEAIERHIWFKETDYFSGEQKATVTEIQEKGDAFVPSRFASFSDNLRRAHPRLTLTDGPYRWIRGVRLSGKTTVYIPAQAVSGVGRFRHTHGNEEPAIVYPITTGLATWPTQQGAYLRGMLEAIERDAFMITWLNQLTLPRFDVDELAGRSATLAALIEQCRRYRLEPHFVRLATDAPTYVIAAILEDKQRMPRFSIGLKASASSAQAAEGALFESLRARRGARGFLNRKTPEAPLLDVKDIGHYNRILYWAEGDRAERLAFLVAGPVSTIHESWEEDSEEQHLERLIAWTKERGYGCAAVSLTSSKANVSDWHIEMVVIPELQRMHFNESEPYTGGPRLAEVPRLLGLKPRTTPYLGDPHPFA